MGHFNDSGRQGGSEGNRQFDKATHGLGARALWTNVISDVSAKVAPEAISNWLTPLRVVAEVDGSILVSAQDQYTLDRVSSEFDRTLQSSWNQFDPKQRRLKFQLWNRIDRNVRDVAGDPWLADPVGGLAATQTGEETTDPASLRDEAMRFETLVVGDSNQRAVGVAKRLSKNGDMKAGVVVIYGQPGTGKTHILKSILAEAKQRGDARRMTYISAGEFVSRFVEGARKGDTADLQAFVKENDLLLIDDLHWIAGKKKTDTAFFGAVRKVTSEGGQVVITADTAPGNMVGFSKELTNEIRGAAAVEVAHPDREMRKEIVRRHADIIRESLPKFQLTDAMVEKIVTGIQGPGRDLCGVLWSLEIETGFGEFAPTDEMLDVVIRRIAGEPRIPSLDDIKRACMETFSLSKTEIESASKQRSVCVPRQIGMFLSRDMTDKSYPQIAHAFRKKDHTTCLHAYRKIKRLIKAGDQDMIRDVELTRAAVFERLSCQPKTS